jgi:hypothetical protein
VREADAAVRGDPQAVAVGAAGTHALADLEQLIAVGRRGVRRVREDSADSAHPAAFGLSYKLRILEEW